MIPTSCHSKHTYVYTSCVKTSGTRSVYSQLLQNFLALLASEIFIKALKTKYSSQHNICNGINEQILAVAFSGFMLQVPWNIKLFGSGATLGLC